jgi:hypothetical protein
MLQCHHRNHTCSLVTLKRKLVVSCSNKTSCPSQIVCVCLCTCMCVRVCWCVCVCVCACVYVCVGVCLCTCWFLGSCMPVRGLSVCKCICILLKYAVNSMLKKHAQEKYLDYQRQETYRTKKTSL